MTRAVITCDRSNGLLRAASWSGANLVDLYLDREDKPDQSGAIVKGKIVRVLSGQKAGWADCGLSENIYCETRGLLQAGEAVTLRIQSTLGQGKAPIGVLLGDDVPLAPPPQPWERALTDLKGKPVELRFAGREDYDLALNSGLLPKEKIVLSKEPVHPDLDERIDALLKPMVSLSGGGHIVIEQTEALVAIDVNAGEGGGTANAAAINICAVREAARQVRLRNLSGIIVIDALKMKNRPDISKVLNALTRVVEEDPSGATVFGLTKLGLIEMTRSRRGPPLSFFFEGP